MRAEPLKTRSFLFLVFFVSVLLEIGGGVRSAAAEGLRVTARLYGGRSCYTAQEAEAEQGLRIHSELMVIALNCQHMTPPGWKNFYQQYQSITARHATLLSAYETTLMNFFVEEKRFDPESALHDLRTDMANRVSVDAARMRPDIFCATYAPRLPKVDKMTQEQIVQWSNAEGKKKKKLSRPLCE